MRYLSVCSGIEAATVAWSPLGWEAVAFAETEPFPAAVLAHHYPEVPNVGDFTQIKGGEFGPVDLLVGGTPCQAFSVAGQRGGLDDERGDLTLEFIRLAGRLRPAWLVWENVPGVLSLDGGRTFGAILGALAKLGYGFAYRILDAQYFGVPQRRRRVFVVGYLGSWTYPAAVLFERHSLSGNPPPGRGEGEEVVGTFKSRSRSGGWGQDIDLAAGGYMRVAPAVTAGPPYSRTGNARVETEALVVANTLRGEGFDGSEDGTGRQNLVVTPIDMRQATREVKERDCNQPGTGFGNPGDPSFTVSAGGCVQAIAFQEAQTGCREYETAGTLRANGPGHDPVGTRIRTGMQVRRLTPRECERLMGLPDNYTLITYRGKPAADGPRYKAIGNSMAVNVMRWIGERIEAAQNLLL